jgi:hypothetical protein
MRGRTFVVRVREAPRRITVEDVQSGRRFVAADLAQAAEQMTRWLESPPPPNDDAAAEGRRADSAPRRLPGAQ